MVIEYPSTTAMYCHSTLPLGEMKILPKIGAMTMTIAMS
jgi:hypothetical protein